MRYRATVLTMMLLLAGCDTSRFTLEPRQTSAGLDITVRNRAQLYDPDTWNWSAQPCLHWIELISRAPVRDLSTRGDQPDSGGWTAVVQTNACVVTKRFVVGQPPEGFAASAPLKVVAGVSYELYVAGPTEDVRGSIMLKAEPDGKGGVRLVPLRER